MRDSHFNFHQKIAMLFILIYIFFMFSSFFRFFICDCVIPVFPWLPIQILTQKKGLIFELWLHDFHFNFHQKIAMLFILTSPGVTRILVPEKPRVMWKPRNTGTRCMYSITYIPKNNTINQVPSIMAGQMLAMFSWIMMIRLAFSAMSVWRQIFYNARQDNRVFLESAYYLVFTQVLNSIDILNRINCPEFDYCL